MQYIFRRSRSRTLTLVADEIHKIMNMADIPACKNTRQAGLHIFMHDRSLCPAVDLDSGRCCQFVLRNQSDAQQKRIAVKDPLGSRDWLAIRTDFTYHNLLYALFATDLRDSMT